MCFLFDNETERREVIGKFLKSGIDAGEQVGYFADMMEPEEVRRWLADMDIDLPEGEKSESFTVAPAQSIYCPSGMFTPEAMLDTLRSCYNKAMDSGYTGARVSGEMSWALRGIPGSDRLVEYEALINEISETYPVTPICQYDVRRFDGGTIMNVLRVHPMMIVRGQIVQNPYYMKPQEFLKEFKKERGSSG